MPRYIQLLTIILSRLPYLPKAINQQKTMDACNNGLNFQLGSKIREAKSRRKAAKRILRNRIMEVTSNRGTFVVEDSGVLAGMAASLLGGVADRGALQVLLVDCRDWCLSVGKRICIWSSSGVMTFTPAASQAVGSGGVVSTILHLRP